MSESKILSKEKHWEWEKTEFENLPSSFLLTTAGYLTAF